VTGVRLSADRYLDAARHMRPRQLLLRPRRLIPPAVLAAGRDGRSRWSGVGTGLGVDAAPQSGPQAAPETTGTFSAAGHTRPFPLPGFWSDERDGLLFLFHLHGFADLARYAAGPPSADADALWVQVLEDWLATCRSPARPAWHPFPTSGRVIAWCAALSRGGWPEALADRMRTSLERQLRLLRRCVEYDIGGNHVLRNAAALTIGGACLELTAARRHGTRLLERELSRQLLADGGHEERSPAYHRTVLADLDDVATVLRRSRGLSPEWLDAARERMRRWLAALAGPDGALPLLNDAWEGPPVAPLTEPFTDLAATGYVVLRHTRDHAVLDVAPVAPPHLPPHAHADVLSFSLWADGEPLVVDPGSFAYAGPARARFRGTAAHATVEIDGSDQCDLWGPFRAAHMPTVRRLRTERRGDAVIVAAEHDGYTRLPDPAVHRRTFLWLPGDGLVVADRLVAARPHQAVSHLPLAPGVEATSDRIGPLELSALGGGATPQLRHTAYSPFLGVDVPALTVSRRVGGELSGWALLRPGATVELAGDQLRVSRANGERLSTRVA
jgi:hypothetical protein